MKSNIMPSKMESTLCSKCSQCGKVESKVEPKTDSKLTDPKKEEMTQAKSDVNEDPPELEIGQVADDEAPQDGEVEEEMVDNEPDPVRDAPLLAF